MKPDHRRGLHRLLNPGDGKRSYTVIQRGSPKDGNENLEEVHDTVPETCERTGSCYPGQRSTIPQTFQWEEGENSQRFYCLWCQVSSLQNRTHDTGLNICKRTKESWGNTGHGQPEVAMAKRKPLFKPQTTISLKIFFVYFRRAKGQTS